MTHGAPLLDTRSERTRAAFLQAFIELIFRQGFGRMSVGDIITEAGMARSTFYEHFSGKEDVLRVSMAHFFKVMSSCVASEEPPAELTWVLEHFWENRRMTDAIFTGHARAVLAQSLGELIERRLRDSETGALVLPYNLAASHIAEAQLALVENWLRGRAFCRPEDMAVAMHRTSRASAVALAR